MHMNPLVIRSKESIQVNRGSCSMSRVHFGIFPGYTEIKEEGKAVQGVIAAQWYNSMGKPALSQIHDFKSFQVFFRENGFIIMKS